MQRHTRSDREQATYRTYDDRLVSQEMIDRALQQLEARELRRERLQQVRAWAVAFLIILALLGACLLIWWRLALAG